MDDASQPMTVKEVLETYDFFDQAIVEHGFTPYDGDYRLVAEVYLTEFPPCFLGGEYIATHTLLALMDLNSHATFLNSTLRPVCHLS